MDAEQRQGTRGGYTNTSTTNQTNFLVTQQIRKDIQTSFIARVDSCQSSEEQEGSKTVAITPLISQTDTEGTALEMVSIPDIPHTRYQHGIAAVIIDPVPGDIVVASVNKNDITSINDQTTEPVNAGSFRQFSQSDSVIHDSIHTKPPEVYMVLRQDKTIKTRGPEGIRVETDKTLDEEALENRLIHIGQNQEEQIDANHTQTIKGTNTITIDGDSSITIKSNSSHKVSGNITVNTDGSINVKAGGSITVEAGGSITLKAPSITFDTPQASFTGNVSIAGGLSQGGGMRSAGARSSNGAVFYNDIHTLRTITADIDAIGGGISLKSHVHSNVQNGPSTTGSPQ